VKKKKKVGVLKKGKRGFAYRKNVKQTTDLDWANKKNEGFRSE